MMAQESLLMHCTAHYGCRCTTMFGLVPGSYVLVGSLVAVGRLCVPVALFGATDGVPNVPVDTHP